MSTVKKERVVGPFDRCRRMNWRTLLVCALAVAFYAGLSLPNSCQASLILVDLPEFTLESVSHTASTAGDSSSDSTSDHPGQPDENPRRLGENAFHVAGSSTGTSSSSSPSPSDGGSPAALARLAARLLADPLLAEWLSGGSGFDIPQPPVNSLFRPPQV